MGEKNLFETLKNKKTKLIIGIILIVLAGVIELSMYLYAKNEVEKAEPFVSIREEGKYGYIDVALMTDYYATYESDDKKDFIYFVWDDTYAYSAIITNKNFEKLKDVYDYSYDSEKEKPKAVRVYGISKEYDKDLTKLSIKYYNELFDKEIITNENFEELLGVYFLDSTYSPYNTLEGISIFMGILAIAGIITIISHFSDKRKINEYMTKYEAYIDKINNEINKDSALYVKEGKIYLTDNYIVSFQSGLDILEYKDIRWIYPHESKYNGATASKGIFVVTNDSKSHYITQINANKKNLMKFDELYETLCNKTPDAMLGYTKENVEKNKKITKGE